MITNRILSLCFSCLCGENLLPFTLHSALGTQPFSFGCSLAQNGSNVADCCHAIAPIRAAADHRALSPRLRQYGGCSCICRRFLWRKSRNLAAALVFPAAHFGDNSAISATRYFTLTT